ncbi:MAG: aminotransferase class III-fold pyridoxal phosphate-dependent enzyme, partial [Crenarchaeota archaeon]|nr:aminotransferase class III-fold pyridoxal phosphate-dependent enzyme [Thermoproteota archaeon]
FARTGKMFSIEHFNAVQDIITVAKSIANGFPLGATVIRSDLDFGYEGAHSSTFGGNAVSLAAANATLDYIIKHRLWERAAKLGDQALKIFNELKDETEILGDVRGKGLFIGLEFVKNKDTKEYGTEERDKITELAYKKGLVVLPAGRSVLRLAPPLTITDENWNYALNILVEIIKEVDKKRT